MINLYDTMLHFSNLQLTSVCIQKINLDDTIKLTPLVYSLFFLFMVLLTKAKLIVAPIILWMIKSLMRLTSVSFWILDLYP